METRGGIPEIYLRAGQICVVDRPALIRTILGSCISVTMFVKRLGLGAICHGFLPSCGSESCRGDCPDCFRFVDCSVRHLLGKVVGSGARRREIEVKIFGGADAYAAGKKRGQTAGVGRQNETAAFDVCRAEGLAVACSDTGGVAGRKLLFDTATGAVFMRRLGGVKGGGAASGETR